jgi:hypothetical protein
MVTVGLEALFYNQAKEDKQINGLINEWRE